MVRTSNVVEDDRDSAGQKPSRQGLGWMGAGLLVGAGITVLALGVDSPPQPTVTTTPVADTRPGGPVGVGEVIPGFPDGLVATTRQEGLSLDLVLWPEAGELAVRSVPVGSSSPPRIVEFDVGGHQLATLVPVRDATAGVLYAGVAESASIISLDVTSFAWHDSLPRTLAYTTQNEGETLIWVAIGGLDESEVAVRMVGVDGGQLRAWGEWGYAMQDRDEIVLFTPEGEIKDTATGRVLDSHSSGWLAIDSDGIELLSAGGGARELAAAAIHQPTGDKASALGAAFSRDGSLVAEVANGVTVISLADDSQIAESEVPAGMPQVVWTTDDEYLLYPARRGVVVLRISDGAEWLILESEVVTGLGVLEFDEQS